jgi:hypothetical protein
MRIGSTTLIRNGSMIVFTEVLRRRAQSRTPGA